MSDRLRIQDLEVSTRLGVYEWEQANPQTIWIDLNLAIDAAHSAARDDVREAIDYGGLITRVRQVAESSRFKLMETLAQAIAADVLAQFKVKSVQVSVKKQALPGIGYAAVEIERHAA